MADTPVAELLNVSSPDADHLKMTEKQVQVTVPETSREFTGPLRMLALNRRST